jgi:nicotinamide riboside kinase
MNMPPMARPRRIALLGAESTGKTQLAQALGLRLQQQGLRVTVVPEVLREWCDRQGRTPGPDEQAGIAREQAHRVLRQLDADVVIADTTPLMTALYSHLLFGDETLYGFALAHQRHYDATLVTGLDVPWVPDGLQRDGPQVREPVDALLRTALARAGVSWQVIYGRHERRLENAMKAITSIANTDQLTLGNRPERS